MRITPLTTAAYFRAKVLCGYLMALFSLAVLYLAGTSMGVRLSAAEWLTMTALLLIGLVPFAVLGVMLGHLMSVDSMGPAMGGITTLFALLGGRGGRWPQAACSSASSSACRPTGWSRRQRPLWAQAGGRRQKRGS